MGHINKNINLYDKDGNLIQQAPLGYKEEAPISTKYPGGRNMLSFTNSKGKHTGSHKPIKNHRGKTIKRGL